MIQKHIETNDIYMFKMKRMVCSLCLWSTQKRNHHTLTCASSAYGALKCVYFVRLNEDVSVARGLNYEITCIIN